MFKKDDILKYNLDHLTQELNGVQDPIIYSSLSQLAESYRYKVLKVDSVGYLIERLNDHKQNTFSVQETHACLILANDPPTSA
jgi:hypothetical protein